MTATGTADKCKVHLRYSFSATGENGMQELKTLRWKILQTCGTSAPISSVYSATGMLPPSGATPADKVTDISIVHTTRGDVVYSFFNVEIASAKVWHRNLWRDLCKNEFIGIRADVIGADGEKAVCQPIYIPARNSGKKK